MEHGSKHGIWAEEEMGSFNWSPCVMEYLDNYAVRLGVPCQDLYVFNWGCGRGRTVLKLLEMGIDAYGVDIGLKPDRNGVPI